MEFSETLQYRNGEFVFSEIGNARLREKLYDDSYWEKLPNDSFKTKSLKAAAVFRDYRSGASLDDSVKKLFKKVFQEFYKPRLLPEHFKDLPLDPHQREGVAWILTRKRSYLAHAPGAGKTAQAITASILSANPPEGGQILFIVPPALTKNWEREIIKFTEWFSKFPTIGVISDSAHQDNVAWGAEFIICPDSMLNKDWVYNRLLQMRLRFIAVDEASRFKDPASARSLALYGGKWGRHHYPGLFWKARHCVFLDGSPMPNRPIELWAPVYALDPESIDCLGYDDFGYRYCGARPNKMGVWEYKFSSKEEELHKKLRKSLMHVVTEDKLNHPERLRSIVVMSEDVRAPEHKTWEQKHLSKISVLTEEDSKGDLARYRKELGLQKVEWAARYIRDRQEPRDESVLVFVWHRQVAEGLAFAISPFTETRPGVVIGGTAPQTREKFFREFQDGTRKILILNIAAGGRGHNLQNADRVIFVEFAWTDEYNRQCEKRASRRGSDKANVRCEYIVCPNSIDEMVLNSVFSKEKRVKRIVG